MGEGLGRRPFAYVASDIGQKNTGPDHPEFLYPISLDTYAKDIRKGHMRTVRGAKGHITAAASTGPTL